MEEEDRYTRITLRIPKDLHSKLQASSDASSKSMNAEIIQRLEQSFAPAEPAATEALALAARLNADLAMARYEAHRRTIEAQQVAENLSELLIEIYNRELTDDLSRAVYSFDELEKLADKPRVAPNDLIATAQKRELDLIAAQAEMKDALLRLTEQQASSKNEHPNANIKSSRTALTKNLAASEADRKGDNETPSRTPKIPGVNAPKRGSKKNPT